MPDLDLMWHEADRALLRCLKLAHESFLAGGLPVGSVITGRNGERVSVGRVVFVAPDPSDDQSGEDPDGIEPEWVVVANLLFLSGVAAYAGPSAQAPLPRPGVFRPAGPAQ